MALLKLETGVDNKTLRTKSVNVPKVDKKLSKFLDDMVETMIKDDGMGLAAPQVSKNIRAFVCIINYGKKQEMILQVVNPVIVSWSEEMIVREEGCLSLPGQFMNVARHKWIVVKFLDKKGKEVSLKLEEGNAQVFQHEYDHLDGVLFVDRVG